MVGEVGPGAGAGFLMGGTGAGPLVDGAGSCLWWAGPSQGLYLQAAVGSG